MKDAALLNRRVTHMTQPHFSTAVYRVVMALFNNAEIIR
jgi:hypothetical protein